MKRIQHIFTYIIILVANMLLRPQPALGQGDSLPRKYVVAASPYLSQVDSVGCFSNSCNFVLTTMRPGEELCFYNGLDLVPISTVLIPTNLTHDNPVARARRLANGLAAVRDWLLTDRSHSAEWDAAVDVPGFLALAATQLRSSPHQPLTVIIVGSPFYVGPSGQLSVFAMSDGYIPSDGTLAVPQGQTPFALGASDAFDGIVVHWAYLHERFEHEQNRFACGRFWTLFCEQQGGHLATFSSAPILAFERAPMDITQSCFKATLDAADSKVVLMRKVIIERGPHPQQTNSVPTSPKQAMLNSTDEHDDGARNSVTLVQSPSPATVDTDKKLTAAFNPVAKELAGAASTLPAPSDGKMGIGCVWISPNAAHPEQADLDLYVTTPDGDVLYYGNTDAKSGTGHYYRDVRNAALTVDPTGTSEKSWEFVELNGMSRDDIAKLRCSVNVFRGSGGPITGVLQVVCQGKKAIQPFTFDTPIGNSGIDREKRPSPFWRDFDIAALLTSMP